MSAARHSGSPGRTTRPGLPTVAPRQRKPFSQRISEDPTVRCRAVIYAFPIYDFDPRTGLALPPDPATGRRRIRLDYVGQTIRPLAVREAEHHEDKPWADLIAGTPVVLAEGEWTKDERDAAEVAAIAKLRPRLNYRDNLDNPQRVPLPRQVEHRHARDRAERRALWIPLEQRTALAEAAAQAAVLGAGLDGNEPRYPLTLAWAAACATGRFLASWPRRLQVAALAAAVWAGTAWPLAGWLGAAVNFPPPVAYGFAAAACGLPVLGAARSRPVLRWCRRRRRQRR